MKKRLIIGVTGGIGSGKSLVSAYIEKSGFPVIKSDDLAKKMMSEDKSLKSRIIKEFGESAYDSDGLNRKYLAEQIFSDPQKAARINAIVHPPVMKKIKELAAQLSVKNNMVFVESAIIYEAELQDNFDYVVLISAEEKVRMQRVMEREHLPEEEIEKRMKLQSSGTGNKELADFVIENNSTLTDLENRTHFVLTLLKSITA